MINGKWFIGAIFYNEYLVAIFDILILLKKIIISPQAVYYSELNKEVIIDWNKFKNFKKLYFLESNFRLMMML